MEKNETKEMKEEIGKNMYELINRLYPICRSITGNGVRETLRIIKEFTPIEIHEVPTGTKVFDWIVPREWNINDAYVKNSKGEKIIDFKKSNLHVLGYSVPIKKNMRLDELKNHLFTLPDHPNWIPYLTSYYQENWGFCITHKQYEQLTDDTYEVVIDSSLENGSLTYGEFYIKGRKKEEILFSCYVCHPSMCNDNLSGVALLTFLAKNLMEMETEYSYRFLFIPETIGAITWLCLNENNIATIKYGLVATCVGDRGNSTYKKTRKGDSIIDKVSEKVLIESGEIYEIIDFFPSGSDERQFSSPSFNLEVGSLVRTIYNKFAEYHTSADNLDFVDPKSLENSLRKYLDIIFILENNHTYKNLNPKCEPQLGRRGLYEMIGSQKGARLDELAILWVLNLSDGNHSLLDIAIRSKMNFIQIKNAADALFSKKLLEKIND